jgi:hypothetical protein
MPTNLDANLNRVKGIIYRGVKRGLITEAFASDVYSHLHSLVLLCGEYSRSRSMLYKLAMSLLNPPVTILAPACPDYSHSSSVYTFNGIGGGVSLLAEKHIAFLERVAKVLPEMLVIIAVADHEADDPLLCGKVSKTREEFLLLVESTRMKIQETVSSYGWSSVLMTQLIPNLVADEAMIFDEIKGNPDFRQRIISETISRSDMYYKISASLTDEEMKDRTIKTAAQYLALARFAVGRGMLVCNHTTTNLSWYLQTDVTLIHNDVEVY